MTSRIIPSEVHLKIMEYLGHEVVMDKYPLQLPNVINFINKSFTNDCEEFGKSLYNENNQIISHCISIKILENDIPRKTFYEILSRVLEQSDSGDELII